MSRNRSNGENEFIFFSILFVNVLVIILLSVGLVIGIIESYLNFSFIKISICIFCLIAIHMTAHNFKEEFNRWKARKTYIEYYSRQFANGFQIFYTRNKPVTRQGKLVFLLVCLLVVIISLTMSGHSIPEVVRSIKATVIK